MSKKGKRKGLSADDKKIWASAVERAEPLNPELPLFVEAIEAPAPRPLPIPQAIEPFRIGERRKSKKPQHRLVPSLDEEFAKTSPNMDKRNFDRLKKGKIQVDGRIDLHGMTLAQAHPALIGFVMNAHVSGKRLLLVITGKGKIASDEGVMPARHGILKHQVPQWLRAAPLAPLVLQVTQAHGKHGGSGAYYVYLRRSR